MATLELKGVGKRYGATRVLDAIDLRIEHREFVVFVGPSGCGKSTLLRLIAGLDPIPEGTFTLDGRRMNDVPPSRRGISMVFQSYALYPHMDVYENMAFGVRLAGLPKAEVEARIAEAARILQLEPLLKRRPRELSGGQRQRVAIGRALARKPDVFLLDEPLSNLDAALRSEVRLEIAKLHQTIGGTMIYVTHDQVEAMTLADKIVVMNAGRIEQVGSPRELYERPANVFVATFIGSPRMALTGVERADARLAIAGGGSIPAPDAPAGAARLTIGMRPDALTLHPDTEDGLAGEIVYSEYLGDNAFSYVRLRNGTLVAVRVPPDRSHAPGERVSVRAQPSSIHYFDTDTGLRIQ